MKRIIGDCTLYCGDCREMLKEMPISRPDTVITDPPYGMDWAGSTVRGRERYMANDGDGIALRWACGLEMGHSKYVFCRWDNLFDGLPQPKSMVTWVKNNHTVGDVDHSHGRRTEVVLFYPGHAHDFPTGRPQDVVFAAKTANENHPSEKPVQLMRTIVQWTRGLVMDPFMGSGTTGVACVKLGRPFIGVEIDPEFYEVACRRIEEAYAQPDLFAQPAVEWRQVDLLDAGYQVPKYNRRWGDKQWPKLVNQ